MPRPRPPYLLKETTRHGKTVWYVRRGTGPRIRINAEYGSPEFTAQYEAALRGEALTQTTQVQTGSLRWLYERYHESTEWTKLKITTRRPREYIFEHILKAAGEKPFSAVNRKSLEIMRDRDMADRPNQARCYLDAFRGLFRWAYATGIATTDPTEGVRNPQRRTGEGFKPWTAADVATFEAHWPQGTRQRVWMHVLLYIGCRRGDAVQLGRQHVKDGVISFVGEKGRDGRRVEVSRRIEPELAETLATGPTGDLAFICGERGEPLTKESFGNMFKAACVAAGIKDKAAHGLRKRSAAIWAERGATEQELMAMFGWLTPSMAGLYTKSANRRRMALGAQDRYFGTQAEHSIPAPTQKVRG